MKKIAALFDLDGVLYHTEPEYDRFWGEICDEFMPDRREMIKAIKGTTLVDTFAIWFSGENEWLRPEITRRMNEFEATMPFNPVPGVMEFIHRIKADGVITAVVTSSNLIKMTNVYRSHPEFRGLFDAILTSEDFRASKPDPDCYLKAAARLKLQPAECVVFEDSVKGLQSGRAAGMTVVGIGTSLTPEALAPLSDYQFPDFRNLDWNCL